MPFPLTDLKRSYGRSWARGAPPDVRPYLLVGREREAQLPRLRAAIEWHERHVGARRSDVDLDELAVLVGDYRLSRCLAACLTATYRFRPPDFEQAVARGRADGRRRWSGLQAHGIDSASALRLHVFGAVADGHGGFVAPDGRERALAALAAELGLEAEALDELLWLDGEENEILCREGEAPAPESLAATYSRRALETVLVRAVSADLVLPGATGQDVKRLYFMMKSCGLVADLEAVGGRRAGAAAGDVRAHVFGPLEVFGPRTRHGERFARAILLLLRWLPELSGSARVLINDREYVLHLDRAGEAIQSATPDAEGDDAHGLTDGDEEQAGTAVVAGATSEERFDSGVEARLFATLRGMEQRGDTHGWHVEHEPEPLIENGVVVVPDFALTRNGLPFGEDRVYVEVIGFWTPAYRERKRQKLAALPPTLPLVLAVQEQLAADFLALPFPVLPYRQRVSAADLISLVRSAYKGERMAADDVRETLVTLLDARDEGSKARRGPGRGAGASERLGGAHGPISEASVRRAIGLSGGAEMAVALHDTAVQELLAGRGWRWVPGFGLCHADWLASARGVCHRLVDAARGGAALEVVGDALRASGLCGGPEAADHLDALLPVLGFEVVWESLFEATVRRKAEGS